EHQRDDPGRHEQGGAPERVDVPGAVLVFGPAVPDRLSDPPQCTGDQRELADGEREAERHSQEEVRLLPPEARVDDHSLGATPEAATGGLDRRHDVDAEQRPGDRRLAAREQPDGAAEPEQQRHDQRGDRENADRGPARDEQREGESRDRDRGREEEQVAVGLSLVQRADRGGDAHGRLRVVEWMLAQGCLRMRAAATVPAGVRGWGQPPRAGAGSARRETAEPASHQRQYASQGTPKASVWIPSARTAANAAATAAAARSPCQALPSSAASRPTLHAMKRSTPATPVSAPSSV